MIASRHQNVKSTNKLVNEAENSGELHLRNRKLKDIDFCFEDCILSDLTHVDLSHNSLNEIPPEICQWQCLHTLNLSFNNIKLAPSFLSFCLLEVLDLSGNQLTHIPSTICDLTTLVVLYLQNNKLVSLPGSIGKLTHCQKLDVSSNQLNSLPIEMKSMSSLKHLDISRNCIYSLPDEIAQLNLVFLNASANKISSIPFSLKDIKDLQVVNFNDNPLTSPPLSVVKKGRTHMFKLMQSESTKTQREQNIMEPLLARKRDRGFKKSVECTLNEVVQAIEQQRLSKSTSNSSEPSSPISAFSQDNCSNQSSPIKRAVDINKENCEGNEIKENVLVTEKYAGDINDTKVEDLHGKNSAANNFTEVDNHVVEAVTKPAEPDSPVKSVQQRILSNNSPEKKPAVSTKVTGFPGYAPPPIKEKPKRRIASHLYGSDNSNQSHYLDIIKPRTAVLNKKKHTEAETDLSFTMRRKTEKIYEELELLEDLRRNIESSLKMPLSQDLLPSLADGVVLCHLANHVKSRSIPTIHVPSPAVPKLSLAKSRRNVDNFLDACVKLGVSRSKLCTANDVMHGKGLSRIVSTVNDLLKASNQNAASRRVAPFTSPSVRIAPSLQFHK